MLHIRFYKIQISRKIQTGVGYPPIPCRLAYSYICNRKRTKRVRVPYAMIDDDLSEQLICIIFLYYFKCLWGNRKQRFFFSIFKSPFSLSSITENPGYNTLSSLKSFWFVVYNISLFLVAGYVFGSCMCYLNGKLYTIGKWCFCHTL